jgi:CRP-like cAMP-binding protein
MPDQPHIRNAILASLPSSEIDGLRRHLHHVTVVLGQVLHEPDSPIEDVFFMDEGVVSLTASTQGNRHVEVGLTGREGFVGTSAVLNSAPYAVHRAFIQVQGSGYRMRASVLRSACEQSATLRTRCLRYIEFAMIQTSQVAACNAQHNLPERLARWLLMVRDRLDSDSIPMTHEFMSFMLGVRRSGVSVAASTLQVGGLIRVQRGHIVLLDLGGLAAASCDCYRTIEANRDRLLGCHRTVPHID